MIPAGVTFDDGRAAADELLRRMPDADGLFAWTDTVAIGAMNRLRELGIRVPAQMAVAGYSGTVLSTIVNPQLTTVEQRSTRWLPRCRTGSGKDRRSVGAPTAPSR